MANRLTERDEYGNADIIGVDSADLQLNLEFDQLNLVTDALNKLADYEDKEEYLITAKKLYHCENCKHITESEKTNRLYCSYHSEGEYRYETYKDDYCSYFE